MIVRTTLTAAAAAALASTVLGAGAPAHAATAALPADAARPAAPTAITPNAWFVDQNQRRIFTVKLDRPLCHGNVDVNIYTRAGKLVDWLYQPVSSCRTSVVIDTDLYDWMAAGALGTGSAKVSVSDYDASTGEDAVRSFPFSVKQAATQTIRTARSGRYVTLSGTTMRYDLRSGFDARWAPAANTAIQYQRLVGSTWKTVATARSNAKGVSSVRLNAPAKATYRVLYPGSATQGSAASAKVVR